MSRWPVIAALMGAMLVGAGCAPSVEQELALGKELLQGAPGAAADARAGAQHLRSAALRGSAPAAFHLGLLYRRGAPGFARDAAAAREWLQEAAGRGLPEAQFILAQMLKTGEGGRPDPAAALRLLQQSAEGDLPEASMELAMVYRQGELGVDPDVEEAQRYLMEAEHAQHHRPPRP